MPAAKDTGREGDTVCHMGLLDFSLAHTAVMHIPLTNDENVAVRNAAEDLNDAQSARAQVVIHHWRNRRAR